MDVTHPYSTHEAASCAFAASIIKSRAAIATYEVASDLNKAAYAAITANDAEQAQIYIDQVTAQLAIANDHAARAAVYQAQGKALTATSKESML